VNARAAEDVESAGEFVLVDGGGAIQPEEHLDVESGVVVDDDFGFAEAGFGLEGLAVVEEERAEEGVQIEVVGRASFLQSGGGQGRKFFQGEIRAFPLVENAVAEGLKKGFHGRESSTASVLTTRTNAGLPRVSRDKVFRPSLSL
jgi:hypothetical protein